MLQMILFSYYLPHWRLPLLHQACSFFIVARSIHIPHSLAVCTCTPKVSPCLLFDHSTSFSAVVGRAISILNGDMIPQSHTYRKKYQTLYNIMVGSG